MNAGDDGLGEEAPSFESFEAALRGARNYVVPTDDLRPRVLEAAREKCAGRKSDRRVACCSATLLLLWMLCLARVEESELIGSRAASPAHLRFERYGLPVSADADWGLAEAFTRLRREQASVLTRFVHIAPGSIEPFVQ